MHGTVVRVDKDEVLVDIGYKSEGVIPVAELSIRRTVNPADEVAVGDEIDALVMTKEDAEGRLILSKKRARFELAWKAIEAAAESGEPVNGKVIEVVKGGLILDLGVRGFLPASLVDIRRVQDLDEFLGKELRCKVIELNRSRNNVVLSRRAVLEDERKEMRQAILDRLNPGDVVEGTISNIVDFGAFVDLDGMDGLIHISELSWCHVNHPSEVLEIGQTVEVKVLDIDRERQRISLGLKQTQSDPWQQVLDSYSEGDVVEGRVTKVVTFGAFVEILPGVEGLVHISELAQHHVENPREVVSQGDPVNVLILEVDGERRRLSLSLKRVEEGAQPVPRADGGESVHSTPNLDLSEEASSRRRCRGRGAESRGRRGRPRPRSSRTRGPTTPRSRPRPRRRRGRGEAERRGRGRDADEPRAAEPRPSEAERRRGEAEAAATSRRRRADAPAERTPARRDRRRPSPRPEETSQRVAADSRSPSPAASAPARRCARRVRAARRGRRSRATRSSTTCSRRTRTSARARRAPRRGILDADGRPTAAKIAQAVFGDRERLAWLEALLHPLVVARVPHVARAARGSSTPPRVCVTEVPLLYEVGGETASTRSSSSPRRASSASSGAASPRRPRRPPDPRPREGRSVPTSSTSTPGSLEELDAWVGGVMAELEPRHDPARGLLAVIVAGGRRRRRCRVDRRGRQPEWYQRMRYPLRYEAIVRATRATTASSRRCSPRSSTRRASSTPTRARAPGAIGLMQLLPETAKGIAARTGGSRFVVDDLPTRRSTSATAPWYLRHLLDKYGDEATARRVQRGADERRPLARRRARASGSRRRGTTSRACRSSSAIYARAATRTSSRSNGPSTRPATRARRPWQCDHLVRVVQREAGPWRIARPSATMLMKRPSVVQLTSSRSSPRPAAPGGAPRAAPRSPAPFVPALAERSSVRSRRPSSK